MLPTFKITIEITNDRTRNNINIICPKDIPIYNVIAALDAGA